MPQVRPDSHTEARSKLKTLLDTAENGQVAAVRCAAATAVVLDAGRLRYFLASVVPSRPQPTGRATGSTEPTAGCHNTGGQRLPTPVLPLSPASSVCAASVPSAEISAARCPLDGTPTAVTGQERPI
jgi:hypothetical protein